jgi:hypothetical protein
MPFLSRPARTAAAVATLAATVLWAAGALVLEMPAAAGATPASGPCPGASCGVDGDPDQAAYVGDGGLLLPGGSFTGTDEDRRAAAECDGCRWALVPMCKPNGLGKDSCGPAARTCPVPQRRMEVYLKQPGETAFSLVGLVCLAPGSPTTVPELAQRLQDVVVEEVPGLAPSFQPEGVTLVAVPTLFASGQPPRMDTRTFTLVGFDVVLDARARWAWTFGDGGKLVTTQPGGGYPDMSVSHVYRRPGQYPVSVTAAWEGWFTVDGIGPFPAGGPTVTQTGQLDVEVREARAVLVAG